MYKNQCFVFLICCIFLIIPFVNAYTIHPNSRFLYNVGDYLVYNEKDINFHNDTNNMFDFGWINESYINQNNAYRILRFESFNYSNPNLVEINTTLFSNTTNNPQDYSAPIESNPEWNNYGTNIIDFNSNNDIFDEFESFFSSRLLLNDTYLNDIFSTEFSNGFIPRIYNDQDYYKNITQVYLNETKNSGKSLQFHLNNYAISNIISMKADISINNHPQSIYNVNLSVSIILNGNLTVGHSLHDIIMQMIQTNLITDENNNIILYSEVKTNAQLQLLYDSTGQDAIGIDSVFSIWGWYLILIGGSGIIFFTISVLTMRYGKYCNIHPDGFACKKKINNHKNKEFEI